MSCDSLILGTLILRSLLMAASPAFGCYVAPCQVLCFWIENLMGMMMHQCTVCCVQHTMLCLTCRSSCVEGLFILLRTVSDLWDLSWSFPHIGCPYCRAIAWLQRYDVSCERDANCPPKRAVRDESCPSCRAFAGPQWYGVCCERNANCPPKRAVRGESCPPKCVAEERTLTNAHLTIS